MRDIYKLLETLQTTTFCPYGICVPSQSCPEQGKGAVVVYHGVPCLYVCVCQMNSDTATQLRSYFQTQLPCLKIRDKKKENIILRRREKIDVSGLLSCRQLKIVLEVFL